MEPAPINSKHYRYTAYTRSGQAVAGDFDARDLEDAHAQLVARDLVSVLIAELSGTKSRESVPARRAPPAARLSSAELVRLAEDLEMLARAGLPLSSGLRVAVHETPHRRLAQVLQELAGQLESGRSLEHVLAAQPQLMPGHLRQLIEAGLRSGTLAEVLTELVDIDRSSHDMWRTVRLAVSYPLLLVAGYALLVFFLGFFVLPGFTSLYRDYGRLPLATQCLLWLAGDRTLVVFGIVAAAGPMLYLLMRALLTPVWNWRVLVKIPFLGPMLLWRSVATWTRLLALFVENGITAPDALRLAGQSITDANLANESRQVGQAMSLGGSLADSLAARPRLPASLVPIVRWGEQAGAVPEALRAAGDLFENRVRLRAELLQSALPPVMFVLVALGALTLFNALIAPLVDMVSMLTGMA